MSERFEVARVIEADKAEIFALLCSPAGHVAIDSSGMLQSAEGASVQAVGDEFLVHMDRESLNDRPMGKYDVRVIITGFDRDRWVEWSIAGMVRPPLDHRYGYRLDPVDGGTRVTSYYDWSRVRDEARGVFPILPEAAIRATLGILARTVETG
ncbi:polyketide cyclase [Gordonia sp. SID5947]|uniref:polyketide cyclase n=1 Tax=Gordonia sp. SID5947 TaxID=2690315 RepID=UPI00136EBEB5|nr:polyketide cyclase [Gordonia sp. SID5947]MYR08284.1 polyketide cyclase [Gordonia sp. SID5947]